MLLLFYAAVAVFSVDQWHNRLHEHLTIDFPDPETADVHGIFDPIEFKDSVHVDEFRISSLSSSNISLSLNLTSLEVVLSGSTAQSQQWCVHMNVNGNVMIGYGLTREDISFMGLRCVPFSMGSKTLQFSLAYITNLKSAVDSRETPTPARCEQLLQVLQNAESVPFFLLEDDLTFDFDVLLDYCSLSPFAAYSLPILDSIINASMYKAEEEKLSQSVNNFNSEHSSYCTLRRVVGSASLSPYDQPIGARVVSINDENETVSILCLEDFMRYLPSDSIRYVLPVASMLVSTLSRVAHSRLPRLWDDAQSCPVGEVSSARVLTQQVQSVLDAIVAFCNLPDREPLSLVIDSSLNSFHELSSEGKAGTGDYSNASLVEYFTRDADFIPGPFAVPITTQMRLYIFLFVTSLKEQLWAEEKIHTWKKALDDDSRPDYLCCSSAYITYIIAVLPPHTSATEPTMEANPPIRSAVPSLRSVLLYLEKWIGEYGTSNDAVISLAGVHAISRFATPGSNESVIPAMIYGDPQALNLKHPVLFASAPSDIRSQETDLVKEVYSCYCFDGRMKYRDERLPLGNFNLIDPNAIVGMVKNIGIMIRQMRTLQFVYAESDKPNDKYLRYGLASDCQLRSLVRVWAYQNSAVLGRHEVGIDTEYLYFEDVLSNDSSPIFSTEEYPDSYFDSAEISDIIANVLVDTQQTQRALHQVLSPPLSVDGFFTVNESVNEAIIGEYHHLFFDKYLPIHGVILQLESFRYLFGTDEFWRVVATLGSIIPIYPYRSHLCTASEKKALLKVLERYYVQLESNDSFIQSAELALRHYGSRWRLSTAGVIFRQNILKVLKNIRGLQATLLLDLGNINAARAIYGLSLPTVTPTGPLNIESSEHIYKYINDGTHYPAYHQVCEERENWISERKLLVRDSSYSRGGLSKTGISENSNMKVCSPKTHYVTYATEVKGGLLDLLVSAKLSGIEVTVLGIGEHFDNFAKKMRAYQRFLSDSNFNTDLGRIDTPVQPCDVVMLLDAYDVLLTPSARQIGKALAKFDTPIVFCGENGIYPNYITASFDRRNGERPLTFGRNNASGYMDEAHPHPKLRGHNLQRFLNSGVIVGMASELRKMYDYVLEIYSTRQLDPDHRDINYYGDDQNAFTQYALVNPHLVSVDTEKRISYSLFKEETDFRVWVMHDFSVLLNSFKSAHVASIHCNGGTKNYCTRIANDMRRIDKLLYSGELDGPYLHKAMLAIWDQDFELALRLLNKPIVLYNATHNSKIHNILLAIARSNID